MLLSAILQILASMLNMTFDGLFQRARRQRMRNGLIIAMSALVLAGGFLAYDLILHRRTPYGLLETVKLPRR